MHFTLERLRKLQTKTLRDKAIKLDDLSGYHLAALRNVYAQKDQLHQQQNAIVLERAELIARLGGQTPSPEALKVFLDREGVVAFHIMELGKSIPEFRDTWESFDNLLRRCAAFIDGVKFLRPAKPVAPAPSIEEARSRLETLRKKRVEITRAPVPRVEYVANVRAAIEKEAKAGETSFDPHVLSGDPFRLQAIVRSDGRSTGIGAGSLLLSLFKNEVLEKLEAMIPDSPEALTAEQREKKLASIDAEILMAERAEEAFIEQADVEGRRISRRIDANPLAVLGVEL